MNIHAEHRLKNDQAETRHVEHWIREFAEAAGLSASVKQAIDLVLVEWLTNVISYAFADDAEHWITLRLTRLPGEVCIEIEDDGREFNPLARPPVDTTVPLEQRSVGGLGIHMVTQFMDAVEYRREGGRNVLTLRKRAA